MKRLNPSKTTQCKLSMTRYLTLVIGFSVLALLLFMIVIVERSITHHFDIQDEAQLTSFAKTILNNQYRMQKIITAHVLNQSLGIHQNVFAVTATLPTHPLTINITPEVTPFLITEDISKEVLRHIDEHLSAKKTLIPININPQIKENEHWSSSEFVTWAIGDINYRVLIYWQYSKPTNNVALIKEGLFGLSDPLLKSISTHASSGTTAKEMPSSAKKLTAAIVGIDISFHQNYLKKLRLFLFIVASFLATTLMVLIHFLTKKGLKPIHKISHIITGIQGGQLNTRLSEDDYPLELTPLVHSFNQMMTTLNGFFEQQASFSADIAHELRTPMTNLITQTQIILQKQRTLEDYENVLYANLEEFERLSKMINDMLFLSQTDHLTDIPDQMPINLIDMIHNTVDYYDAISDDNQMKINFLFPSAQAIEPIIIANRDMIKRALSNILTNALTYATPNTDITLTLTLEDNFWRITCTNTINQPIPTNALDKLFDRFYRLDPARHNQSKKQGFGIGLALTKAIILAHKGRIQGVSKNHTFDIVIHLPQIEPKSEYFERA